jgi:hypothetical protein
MRIQHPGIANILGLPISWDCQYPGIANILGLPISWDCQYPGIAFCDAFDIDATSIFAVYNMPCFEFLTNAKIQIGFQCTTPYGVTCFQVGNLKADLW